MNKQEKENTKNLTERITAQRIMDLVDFAGTWERPYEIMAKGLSIGANYVTGEAYKGVNKFTTNKMFLRPLVINGNTVPRSNYWITIKQAIDLKATLKPEFKTSKVIEELREKRDAEYNDMFNETLTEKERLEARTLYNKYREEILRIDVSVNIVYYQSYLKPLTEKNEKGEDVPVMEPDYSAEPDEDGKYPLKQKTVQIFFAKYSKVYPIEVFDNLKDIAGRLTPVDSTNHSDTSNFVMDIANNYCDAESINLSVKPNSFEEYIVDEETGKESINLPEEKQFKNEKLFSAMLFKMLSLTTKSEKRLNRVKKEKQEFENEKEEMINELASLLLTSELNIFDESAFNNSLAKIKECHEKINSKNKLDIYFAAINASKSAQYIEKYIKNFIVVSDSKDKETNYWNESLGWTEEVELATHYSTEGLKKLTIPAGEKFSTVQIF